MTIGVAGCVAQAEGGEIMRRAPAVDLVVGPQSYQRLPDLVGRGERRRRASSRRISRSPRSSTCSTGSRRRPRAAGGTAPRYAAFLTVQEGCDKFCAFCVVPYTRGAEVSRPVAAIVAEATRLAEEGVREVTLLGQNVNAWARRRARTDELGPRAASLQAGGDSRASTGSATPPATPTTWTTR